MKGNDVYFFARRDVRSLSASLQSFKRKLQNHFEKSLGEVKATFHSTIFDILMRPLREDQRHRRRFTR